MAWFGVRKPKKKEAPPVERMELRLYFFGTGVLLVALTYWMLYDEARPRRPWKDYQVRFSALEYRMVQDELAEARRALAAREPEVRALEAELRAAEAAVAGPEMEKLLQRKEALEKALGPKSEAVLFIKAELDEAHYYEEKALFDGRGNREAPEYQKARGSAKRIEERLIKAQQEEEPLAQELEKMEAQVRRRNEAAQKVSDKLAELRAPVVNLERRLAGIRGRVPEIQQVIIEGLDINEFKQPTLRVDRCTTCHVGTVRPGFEREKLEKYGVSPGEMKVFMSHPYQEALIGKHPTNQYGCSSCHRGQPPALEADEAHSVLLHRPQVHPAGAAGRAEAGEPAKGQGAPAGAGGRAAAQKKAEGRAEPAKAPGGHDLTEKHFYWDRPLLLGEMVQASCRRCHVEQDVIPLAPVYSEARAMVADLGCYGCHNIRGFEKGERVGPTLTKIRTKVDPGWLVRWIKNPKEYLPKTKMPVFKNGPGEDPTQDFMTTEQVTAIAAYLWKASADDPEQSGAYQGGDVEKGKDLVRNVGCLGCHVIKGLEPPAPTRAPSGAPPPPQAEEKKDAEGTPEEAKAAAQAKVAAWVAVKPSPPPGHDFGPDLSNVASKVNADWLYRWLLIPKRYNPATKMPNMRLSPEEAGHITAFLMTQGRKVEQRGLLDRFRDEALIKEGERLIRKRGCSGCHSIVGFETADKIAPDLTNYGTKRLLELFFGEAVDVRQTWEDFTLNKLLNPQIYATERVEQIMPNFRFTLEQAKALRVFLKAQNDDRAPRAMTRTPGENELAIQEGRRLVRRYNCDGCHVMENQGGEVAVHYEQINLAPPPLVVGNLQEGEKVQSTWLYEWLARPTSVRPWLHVRMPTFGLNIDEATSFARYFGALAGVRLPYEFIRAEDIPIEYLREGRKLASKDYFDCFSCHVQGSKNPEGPPEGWAPDLALARYRLRPAWIEKWLRDPQRIQPGTKMPSFFTDTEGIPDDILRDPRDPDKKKQLERQIRAVTDYVMSLGEVQQQR